MGQSAEEYIRETSLLLEERYVGICSTYACRAAELLLAERRSPWIGRVRLETRDGNRVFRHPLIARRYAGRGAVAWTTHYVACSGRTVFDPLVGDPTGIEGYASVVFGLDIPVETHLDAAATETLLRSGEILATFHPRWMGR